MCCSEDEVIIRQKLPNADSVTITNVDNESDGLLVILEHSYSTVPERVKEQTKILVRGKPKMLPYDRKCLAEKNSCSTLNESPMKSNMKNVQPRLVLKPDIPSNTQKSIKDFFQVRASIRKTSRTVREERRRTIEEAVLANKEEGLEIKYFENKGRGVVATRNFVKGEFVVEYAGELISMEEAQRREMIYAKNENIGCYMYYFKHKDNQYCIDATAESNRLGRLVNHSRNGNLCTKTIEVNGVPHLVLLAKEDIEPGCELTYDYGDRSKLSLQYHPWLAL